MSPVEDGHTQCFAVRRGRIEGRIDSHFYKPEFQEMLDRLRKINAVPLGSMISSADETWDVKDGRFVDKFPYIEISGVTLGTNEYKISDVLVKEAPSRARLVVRKDDIIVSMTRPHRGAIAMIREEDDGAIASTGFSVLRDMRRKDVSREYLLYSLFTDIVLKQMLMRSSGGNYPAITAEEMHKILIPVTVNFNEQNQLVQNLLCARSNFLQKTAAADALLSGVDEFLGGILELPPTHIDNRKTYAVQTNTIKMEGRLNSDYYHPERILALRSLESVSERMSVQRLSEIVSFERNQVKEPGENYLSLAHVQSHTGELVDTDESAAGTCFTYETDDVLFTRLRPYLNKVYRADKSGCCSPEFHVLRIKNRKELLPEYLAAILRSKLTLAQTVHMMTGNTHPRLANEDVINLRIPVPSPATQMLIANEVQRRRAVARQLRLEADEGWEKAKKWFEEQLLGG